MNSLTIFGLFAVSALLVSYALESRSRYFILAFTGSCVLASAYGLLREALPFRDCGRSLVAGRCAGGERLAPNDAPHAPHSR